MKKPSIYFAKRTGTVIFAASLSLLATEASAKEYIVKLKNNQQKYTLNNLETFSNHSYKVSGIEEGLKLVKVNARDDASVEADKATLKNYFDAEYVVENIKLHAFNEVSDPRRSEQWSLDIIHANEAWNSSLGSSSVVVAVVDTGINLTHEDLKANIWVNQGEVAADGKDNDNNGFIDDVNGWDFHGNDKDPNDETGSQNPGHGTHCSGIVGAVGNNGVGVSGISPKVSLMALRFLDENGSGDLFASVRAIEYAVKNGAHVISASWGANVSESEAQPIIDAIKKAEESGVIFIAAAANDGRSNDSASVYPANSQTPNMISVAASDSSDSKPSWSNYGRKVDLAAPGADILSTVPGGYQKLSGTSMATPLVAGLVALMKSLDINLSGAQARSILQSTGAKVNIETASNSRIDAEKALEAVANKSLTLVPAAHTFKIGDEFNFSAWGGTAPYRFSSASPDLATIDESGHLVAKAVGDVVIEVTDSLGNKASSVSIKISDGSGDGGGGGGDCPLDNPFLCAILCIVNPQLPWCQDGGGLPDLPELPELP